MWLPEEVEEKRIETMRCDGSCGGPAIPGHEHRGIAFNTVANDKQLPAFVGLVADTVSQNSAASGGPLLHVGPRGRSAVIFYCTIGMLATQLWACSARSPSDSNASLAAKFFLGLFGRCAVLGPPLPRRPFAPPARPSLQRAGLQLSLILAVLTVIPVVL